mgnify:CR=1 FL=1
MLWFGKSKEKTDIFRLVRVNDRMQVDIGGKTYLSRVEDIRDGELHIAAPVERGGVTVVRPGLSIVVNLFEGMGIRRFSGRVLRVETGRVETVVVSDLEYLGTVQRREHVRISQRLPVRFRLEDGPNGQAPWFEGATQDVSGGGLQITADARGIDAIVKGDLLEIELYLPDQNPVKAVGQIVRASSTNPLTATTVRFGVQFVEISGGERSRIVRYVLKKQSEMLASRREFTACNQRIPVQYRINEDDALPDLLSTYTRDISVNGLRMALAMGDSQPVGAKLFMYIALPGLQTIEAEAEITWAEEGKSGAPSQVGVKFTNIDRQSQKMIEQFISQDSSKSSGEAKAA